MKTPNRDLLVLLRDEFMSEKSIEAEVELLNDLLYCVESSENFCLAHEVADLNKYRMLRGSKHILEVTRYKHLKPFQFLLNKN